MTELKFYYLILIIGLVSNSITCFTTAWPKVSDGVADVSEIYESGDGEDDKCDDKHDVAILLDTSQSIGPKNFRHMKIYTQRIANFMSLTKCDRIALAKFSDFANSELFFNTPDQDVNVKSVLDEMNGPRHQKSEVTQSRIDTGLSIANKLLFSTMLGLRVNSKKTLVVMTDGQEPEESLEIHEKVKDALKELNQKGVRIIVLQIGENESITKRLKDTYGKKNVLSEKQKFNLLSEIYYKQGEASDWDD